MMSSDFYKNEVERTKRERQLKCKPAKDPWPQLRRHTAYLVGLVKAGASKYVAYENFIQNFPDVPNVSPHVIYRFIKDPRALGHWPNAHKKDEGEI